MTEAFSHPVVTSTPVQAHIGTLGFGVECGCGKHYRKQFMPGMDPK